MKKYNKPIVELENIHMTSIMLASDSITSGGTGTFDDTKKSFGDLFGGIFGK